MKDPQRLSNGPATLIDAGTHPRLEGGQRLLKVKDDLDGIEYEDPVAWKLGKVRPSLSCFPELCECLRRLRRSAT